MELEGKLELRGTYDDNALLTAEDFDGDLRLRDRNDTEEDDFFATLRGELVLTSFPTDWLTKRVQYEFEVERYRVSGLIPK